jgi:hypothetical protein
MKCESGSELYRAPTAAAARPTSKDAATPHSPWRTTYLSVRQSPPLLIVTGCPTQPTSWSATRPVHGHSKGPALRPGASGSRDAAVEAGRIITVTLVAWTDFLDQLVEVGDAEHA